MVRGTMFNLGALPGSLTVGGQISSR